HTATLLKPNPKGVKPQGVSFVLIAGGYNGTANSVTFWNTAELFDPQTKGGVFTYTAPMKYARHGFTATLLLNGWVLVTGGQTAYGPNFTSSAEIFVPAGVTPPPSGVGVLEPGSTKSGAWYLTGSMSVP